MKQCIRCGKHPLFSSINENGYCKNCVKELSAFSVAEAARVHTESLSKSACFLHRVAFLLSDLPSSLLSSGYPLNRYLLSKIRPDRRREIRIACNEITYLLSTWRDYDTLGEVFLAECIPDESLSGCIRHPKIPCPLILKNSSIDFSKIFDPIVSDLNNLESSFLIVGDDEYLSVVVYDLISQTGRRSQQAIFRNIYYHKPPYESSPEIHIEREDNFGTSQFIVYTNNEPAGTICTSDAKVLMERWERYKDVCDYDLAASGSTKYFAMRITIRFYWN